MIISEEIRLHPEHFLKSQKKNKKRRDRGLASKRMKTEDGSRQEGGAEKQNTVKQDDNPPEAGCFAG